MKTDISNVLTNASRSSVGSNPVNPAYAKAEEHVKKEREFVPEAERWIAKMREIDEKRKSKNTVLKTANESLELQKKIDAILASAKTPEQKAKASKKSKKSAEKEEPKSIVIEAGSIFSYKETIQKPMAGTIEADEYIKLMMDLRSLVSNEKSWEVEASNINPSAEKRFKDFCSKINFSYDEFISLNRVDRQHLVLHAYVGYSQNIAFGLQLSAATDLAAVTRGSKCSVDYLTRQKMINDSFNTKRVAPVGSNTEAGHKNILNFAGRAKVAALETFGIMEQVNKPDYRRDLALFKKAAMCLIEWISCESVLKMFEEEIRANGYTDFASKDAETFLMIARLSGFNVSQAQALIVASLNEPLYTDELIDAFVAKLVKLDNVTVLKEGSAAFAKLGDLKKKFNKIVVSSGN